MQTEGEIRKNICLFKIYSFILIILAVGITALIAYLSDLMTWYILIALLWTFSLAAVLFLVTRIRHLNDAIKSLRYVFPIPIEVGSHQV
jgi:hypothetical protein